MSPGLELTAASLRTSRSTSLRSPLSSAENGGSAQTMFHVHVWNLGASCSSICGLMQLPFSSGCCRHSWTDIGNSDSPHRCRVAMLFRRQLVVAGERLGRIITHSRRRPTCSVDPLSETGAVYKSLAHCGFSSYEQERALPTQILHTDVVLQCSSGGNILILIGAIGNCSMGGMQ